MEIKIPQVEAEKRTPETDKLYEIIYRQAETIQKLTTTIELLKEEINRLKGHKGKPNIKSSAMENRKKGSQNRQGNPGATAARKALKKEELTIKATDVPEGSRFKGYQIYDTQELTIEAKEVRYRLERWQTSDGLHAANGYGKYTYRTR